jgi:DNA-binding transcriptional MocR family regulator
MGREKGSGYAYHAVYRYLSLLIDAVEPGTSLKLPSLRQLARHLDVSIATIQSAYALLESEGRVFCVPKSGYFTRAEAREHGHAQGGDLFEQVTFNATRPDMRMLGRGQPWHALDHAMQRQERQLWRQYPHRPGAPLQPCGELELRRLLASRYTRSTRCFWSAEQVYIGVDLRAVLELLIQAMGLAGNTVLVTSPGCPMVMRVLQDAGVELLEVPLSADGRIDLDNLAQRLRQHDVRLMVLDSAHTVPQGTLIPDSDKRDIARLLDSHGVWVLENDVEGDLCFEPCLRVRDLIDPDRLLVISSFEKLLGSEAPYGYLLTRQLAEPLQRLFVQRSFRLPILRQKAIARLYGHGVIDEHLLRLRAALRKRLLHMAGQVRVNLADQLQFELPRGGTGLWLKARHSTDMGQVFERLLGTSVVIEPGAIFSLNGLHAAHLRLGCVPLEGEGASAVWTALGEVLRQEDLE